MKAHHCKPGQLFIVAIIIGCAALFLFPSASPAHRPGNVTLKYDQAAGILSVSIMHSVSNPSKHYIEKITIWKNGSQVHVSEYENQSDKESFTYEYSIKADKGDELKVKAECSYFGSRTETIIVDPGQ
jgi:desulfoferrodoxin (superoxide reductase-like protein)